MDAYFILTLDTTPPSGTSIAIASPTNNRTVGVSLSATDAEQMKLYGDIVKDVSSSTKITEDMANWISYNPSTFVVLSDEDGPKTVYAKFRDDVGNESAPVSVVVILDTSAPIVTVDIGPDYSRISKRSGSNTCTFIWSASESFKEYKVCVVPANTSPHNEGIAIGVINGSTNMSGIGMFIAGQAIISSITDLDLKAASDSDGAKIIKVFVKDISGNWSL